MSERMNEEDKAIEQYRAHPDDNLLPLYNTNARLFPDERNYTEERLQQFQPTTEHQTPNWNALPQPMPHLQGEGLRRIDSQKIARRKLQERTREADPDKNDSKNNNTTLKVLHGDCTQEGFFGMPGLCRNFYHCAAQGGGLSKIQMQCPPGTVFDTKRGLCDHPWAAAKSECGHDNKNQLGNDTWDTQGQWTGRSSTENGSANAVAPPPKAELELKSNCPPCPLCPNRTERFTKNNGKNRSSGQEASTRLNSFWSHILVLTVIVVQ